MHNYYSKKFFHQPVIMLNLEVYGRSFHHRRLQEEMLKEPSFMMSLSWKLMLWQNIWKVRITNGQYGENDWVITGGS